MPETVQHSIKRLISHRAPSLAVLRISWFGGEPLAARDILLNIARHAKSEADKNSVAFSGGLTTNGYLISNKVLHELIEVNHRHFQITLDGDKDWHDKTRVLNGGKPTFERIWENLLLIRDFPEDAHVMLRMHVSGENTSSLKAAVGNSRVLFQPGQGSLRLEWLHISNGKSNDRGGCIASNGNVTLHESSVTDCTVHGIADPQFPALGGGVYAAGNVRLENGVSMRLNKAISSAADAMGGAVHAGGTVNLVANGSVELVGNHVSASGNDKLPHGGAIYAVTGVTGTAATVIHLNQAIGNLGKGGGIYSEAGILGGRWEISENRAGQYGGGIYHHGAAIIGNLQVTENEAAIGAGIYSNGNLTLTNSLVADNTATTAIGGIDARQDLTLRTSAILGNTGLGIQVMRNASIENSTISGNTATGWTSGLRLGSFQTTSLITIDQSTISHNGSTDSTSGAGLWLYGNARIRNNTIYANSATNASGSRHGTGISLGNSSVQLELISNIVSGNQVGVTGYSCLPTIENCFDNIDRENGSGGAVTGQANLIGSATISLPADTIVSDYPGLAALADNGGPTPTHLPNSNSQARDAGVDSGFETDQRGEGFPRVLGMQADIGAVEAGGGPIGDAIFSNGFED